MTKDEATLDVYRHAIYLLYNRIKWDLNPASFVHRRKLRALQNSRAGRKAVILCNGPSLNEVDFESLGDVFTFGLNKINLLFDRTSFRPDAIVATNMQVVEQNADFYNITDIPLLFDSKAFYVSALRKRNSITFFHSAKVPGFARDCSLSVNPSHTVTSSALQLAYHFGFTSVALVGCDHSFAVSGKPNSMVSGIKEDHSHFDTRYFSNVEWQLPDLGESEVGYMRAKAAFEQDDRVLVNATVGGKLEVLPRMSLQTFLSL